MVGHMSYDTVTKVVDSFEAVRRIENYDEKAGVLIFKKFFSLEPRAIKVFSFGRNIDSYSEDLLGNRQVIEHGKHYVKMVSRAIDLLGPDIELLTEILLELGKQHERFGVQPEFYPPMGQALLSALSELLGDKFSEPVRAAWVECYQVLAEDMIRATKAKA
mmetsp:Transcript_32943/g.79693  ORF Transcript_32943/g.79693 Transcript_32943/m.79693 type:complete len:161 (+) Transcript_32943:38-520(+)